MPGGNSFFLVLILIVILIVILRLLSLMLVQYRFGDLKPRPVALPRTRLVHSAAWRNDPIGSYHQKKRRGFHFTP